MADYLICSRPTDDPLQARLSNALKAGAERQDLRPFPLGRRSWMIAWGPRPPEVRRIGPWRLIGDVIDRKTPPRYPSVGEAPCTYERQLLARFWGRFVGVRFNSDGRLTAILRDPSGALDAVVWSAHGLDFVASDIPFPWGRPLIGGWRVSSDRLATALRDPLLVVGELLLDGPQAVLPGTLRRWPGGETVRLWTPAEQVRTEGQVRNATEAAERLRRAVDEAVKGLAARTEAIGAEVSGGLDSSIVAASLAPVAKVRLWLNAHGPDPSGDERGFAEALARRHALRIDYVPRKPAALSRDDLDVLPLGLRPAVAGLDLFHDRLWAERCAAAGVTALFTGKGGDSVFAQPAGPSVYDDLWRRIGPRALFDPSLYTLARLNERSVWTLVAGARRPHPRRSGPATDPQLIAASALEPPTHPWLEADLSEARAVQVMGLVQGLSLHGPSALTPVADLFHPLLAQPVVETCLGLTLDQLTLGRRDRALARRAFADRLPAEIVERRSKGEITAYFGRMIADSLGALRPWLLDGALAGLGLLDRPAAERLLTRENLIWRGRYADLLIIIVFERWVRVWSARLSG